MGGFWHLVVAKSGNGGEKSYAQGGLFTSDDQY
jgi:hypothetical protein